MVFYYFFFFSSRRRHTRLQGDWSSDVCSSDLFSPHSHFYPRLPFVSARKFQTLWQRWSARQERSEEHTSELQSPCNLVCRLLLEKKSSPPPRGRRRPRSTGSSPRSAT